MTGKTPSVPQINHVDKSLVGGSFALPRVIAIVYRHARKIVDLSQFGPDTRLDELGLNELDLAQIADETEAAFGFAANDFEWDAAETIGDLISLVEAKGG